MWRSCSDSPPTASQMDRVFGSYSGIVSLPSNTHSADMRLRVGNRNGHLCFKSLGGRLAEFFTRVAHIGPCGGRGSNAADNPLQRKYEYPLHGRTYMPPRGLGHRSTFPNSPLPAPGRMLSAGRTEHDFGIPGVPRRVLPRKPLNHVRCLGAPKSEHPQLPITPS